jgi:hypothetical protein
MVCMREAYAERLRMMSVHEWCVCVECMREGCAWCVHAGCDQREDQQCSSSSNATSALLRQQQQQQQRSSKSLEESDRVRHSRIGSDIVSNSSSSSAAVGA